jgi:hypothetical protein
MTLTYNPKYVSKHKVLDRVKIDNVNTKVDKRNMRQVHLFFMVPPAWE